MRVKFFIIRPPLCKHEGDEMSKILYYYPQDETDQKKLQAIGLGQGTSNLLLKIKIQSLSEIKNIHC